MRNVVLDGVRKILETYYMIKFWKLYESENSENLARWSLSYSLFQHSKVTALEVLQDDGKYISKETFWKTYFSKETF